MALLLPFEGREPRVHPSAWLAPTATLIGDVTVEADAVVLFGAVLRGDMDRIVLGRGSNLQDNVVVHVDAGRPTLIGADVSVGHAAVVHGCTIEDEVLVGMASTVLNGAVVGTGSIIAAGALVREGMAVPPRSLVAGVPGAVKRPVPDEEFPRIPLNAHAYRELAARYRAAEQG